jgi:hypothetical protein
MLGAYLTARTQLRLAAATGPRRRVQLVMSSLIAGATFWATHFITMLAYDPGVEHGYEPVLTGLSLCIAFLGAFGTNTLFFIRSTDEFSLVYQLQNQTGSREVAGFEVLLRWRHPRRGPVSPVEFIPLAEESGLILDIVLFQHQRSYETSEVIPPKNGCVENLNFHGKISQGDSR